MGKGPVSLLYSSTQSGQRGYQSTSWRRIFNWETYSWSHLHHWHPKNLVQERHIVTYGKHSEVHTLRSDLILASNVPARIVINGYKITYGLKVLLINWAIDKVNQKKWTNGKSSTTHCCVLGQIQHPNSTVLNGERACQSALFIHSIRSEGISEYKLKKNIQLGDLLLIPSTPLASKKLSSGTSYCGSS